MKKRWRVSITVSHIFTYTVPKNESILWFSIDDKYDEKFQWFWFLQLLHIYIKIYIYI